MAMEAPITLEQALELAQHLNPADRIKLRQVLDDLMTETPMEERERLYEQLLVERGLMMERKPTPVKPRQRRPVPVQGTPLSETIIEERR